MKFRATSEIRNGVQELRIRYRGVTRIACLSCAVLLGCILFIAAAHGDELAVFNNRNATLAEIKVAAAAFKGEKDLPDLWISLANNPALPIRHRALFICELIGRHGKAGMTWKELCAVLRTKEWCKREWIGEPDAEAHNFSFEIDFMKETLIYIAPFSEHSDSLGWAYIKLAGNLYLDHIQDVAITAENRNDGSAKVLHICIIDPGAR